MLSPREKQLQQALLRCRDEGIGTDFTIQVGNIDIPCHRSILAAESKYFLTVLGSAMSSESILGCARFDQLKPDAALNVVRSIYTGDPLNDVYDLYTTSSPQDIEDHVLALNVLMTYDQDSIEMAILNALPEHFQTIL